jgi:hypothetical protein
MIVLPTGLALMMPRLPDEEFPEFFIRKFPSTGMPVLVASVVIFAT